MNEGRIVMEGDPTALIRDNIERFVLEVIRPDVLKREGIGIDVGGLRMEKAHDAMFLFSNDAAELNVIYEKLPPGVAHVRPANLEDLFLRTTGRNLNEAQ